MSVSMKDIVELNAKHVHIKNKDEVINKINLLITGGKDSLQVVSDYDMTLTKQHENGKQHVTSFGMIHKCRSMSKEYYQKEQKLYREYRPIEIDPYMPNEEKVKHMEHWWRKSEDLLKGISLPVEEFDEVAKIYNPALRDGTADMISDLYKENVPVLVFSAGLGDSVVAVLKHNQVLHPNVKVISNYLDRDENNKILGYRGNMITVLNKNEQVLKGTEYYDLVQNRGNVILMGDHVGDAGMAEGVPHRNTVLKIGFLYDSVDVCLPEYLDAFDIVLIDDQTMDVPRALIKLIVN
ncbi:cytosolic 5'-nucleotidase IIIB [Carabus blaptoides fortunei]